MEFELLAVFFSVNLVVAFLDYCQTLWAAIGMVAVAIVDVADQSTVQVAFVVVAYQAAFVAYGLVDLSSYSLDGHE